MIPLRDENPTHSRPIVTTSLLIANVLMFFWELSLGPRLGEAVFALGVVPARLWLPGNWTPDGISILASMFLHGGWLHIGSNMLYLWIFGDNIEDQMGHGRFLVFYLLCGVAATYAHAILNAGSRLPSIGASGAIAGVLGAYLLLFPHARVRTLIPLGFFITVGTLPAILVLGLWFVLQLFTGVAEISAVPTAQEQGGVAYFAHIGGFVAGMLLLPLFRRRGGRRPPAGPAGRVAQPSARLNRYR